MSTATKVMLALLLVLAAVCGWLLWNIDFIQREVDIGFSQEAERRPYLAASLFLEKHGVEAEPRQGLALLDTLDAADSAVGANDTLALFEAYNELDYEQIGKLLTWVSEGGTVIYAAQNRLQGESLPEQDIVLDFLGVELFAQSIEEAPMEADFQARLEEAARAYAEDRNELLCDPYMGLVQVGTGAAPARMNFAGNNALGSEAVAAQDRYGDARGTQLMIVPWAEGRFIVTTDGRVWDNHHLACHDHAYALLNFTRGGKAWLVENRNATSLLARLWQLSAIGCTLVMLALLLQLHRGSRRFGPLLATPMLGRRSFLEHLEAGAQLLWDRRQGRHLVELLRRDIHSRMQKLDARFRTFSSQQQCEAIAQMTRLPLGTVRDAMDSPLPEKLKRDTLQSAVAELQKIRTLM